MKKLILTHHYTNRCIYGNVYHAITVENIRNGKRFTVHTPSLENVQGILRDAFGGWDKCESVIVPAPTGSARSSSLPEETVDGFLDQCHFSDEKHPVYNGSWRKELNKIGFRLPRAKA